MADSSELLHTIIGFILFASMPNYASLIFGHLMTEEKNVDSGSYFYDLQVGDLLILSSIL